MLSRGVGQGEEVSPQDLGAGDGIESQLAASIQSDASLARTSAFAYGDCHARSIMSSTSRISLSSLRNAIIDSGGFRGIKQVQIEASGSAGEQGARSRALE